MTYAFASNEFMNGSPAMVNPDTGLMVLNRDTWHNIPGDERRFIKAHEKGHYVLQTISELQADKFAYDEVVKETGSRKAIMAALAGQLNDDIPAHRFRALVMLIRCLKDEYAETNNPDTLRRYNHYVKIYNSVMGNNDLQNNDYGKTSPVALSFSTVDENGDIVSFLGKGKKAAAKNERKTRIKDARADYRVDRYGLKNDAKAGRISNAKTKADGRMALNQMGIETKSPVVEVLKVAAPMIQSGISAFVPGMTPGASALVQDEPMNPQGRPAPVAAYDEMTATPPKEKNKNRTMLYVGIGIAIVVLVILFSLKKNKKK
jgi:hypothetical protein